MTQPNQSAVQQSIRDMTGTALTFEGDWLALFDDASIAAGTFNERQLAWLNQQLGTTYSNLSEARQAYAELLGYNNWDQTRDVAPWLGAGALYALNAPTSQAYVNSTLATFVSGFNAPTTAFPGNRWRVNTAGSLIAYAAGEPRVADGSLLVEGAGTNIIPFWDDVSGSGWADIGAPGASATANEIFLPADGNRWGYRHDVAISPGDTWYFQARVRAAAGEKTRFIVQRDGGGVFQGTEEVVTFTGEWQTVSVAHAFTDTYTRVQVAAYHSPLDVSAATSVEIDEVILSDNFILSPIPTSGTAVTRSAEVPLAKQGSGPVPYPGYLDGPGFLTATFKNLPDTGSDRTVLSLSDGTTDEQVKVHVDASDDLILTANTAAGTPATATIASGIDLAAGGTVAVAYNGTNVRASFNGGAVATAAKVLDTSAMTELHVACDEAGAEQLNGEIVSTDAGDGTFTDAQLQAKAQ